MIEKDKKPTYLLWVQAVQARGLENAAAILLDVIEPIGSVLAQLLWVVQPAAGIIGARQMIADLAEILDEPDGIATIRARLLGEQDDDTEP